MLRIWSFGKPHHRAFQLSWMSFMIAFFATFAAPPLMPQIRNDLNLTKQDISAAATASVCGAVFSRILLGMGERQRVCGMGWGAGYMGTCVSVSRRGGGGPTPVLLPKLLTPSPLSRAPQSATRWAPATATARCSSSPRWLPLRWPP